LSMSSSSCTFVLMGLPCNPPSSASLSTFLFSPVGSAIFAFTGELAAVSDAFLFSPEGSAALDVALA